MQISAVAKNDAGIFSEGFSGAAIVSLPTALAFSNTVNYIHTVVEGASRKGRYEAVKATSGNLRPVEAYIMFAHSGVAERLFKYPVSTESLTYLPAWNANLEALEVATSTTSRMDMFLTQTLPVIAAVLASAWVMYTRLDDGINDARVETKQDFKSVNELIEARFNRSETKIDALDTKLDQKLSSVLQQVTDLRVRQTQSEAKQ
ncbi:hypothetical protein V466_29175 [Pseudomonas mandelii PD30]|jgi:hypothetical protein|uniref:Uncharacterized protein n=1 Tax=Pseudomonas mandelii PD30 TaxID=1419583 RepID=A0A059KTU0_9PSED|nr:hypothetical protein [Pseudomonas mandelii]KDD65508.1 hypothetical protein V466_29175 [Pseudomonas mandelii PD30]